MRQPAGRRTRRASTTSDATVGFDSTLWAAADLLRGNLDPGDYRHAVLGLNFPKLSDAFERLHKLVAQKAKGADPEDSDEHRVESIFRVSRYSRLHSLP